MVDNRTVTEMAGDLFIERRKQDGTLAAAMIGRPTGSTTLTAPQERAAFWKRAMTPEQEAQLWQQGLAEAAQQGINPDDAIKQLAPKISAQVYTYRWQMAAWGGRDTPDKVAAWASKHAAAGPPDDSLTPARQNLTEPDTSLTDTRQNLTKPDIPASPSAPSEEAPSYG
jgi:hypothetical protein